MHVDQSRIEVEFNGNICLFLGRQRPLSLAPSYDMLPMLYRPDPEGGIPARQFMPPAPPPDALGIWRRASTLAKVFWARVEQDTSVSEPFRTIAAANFNLITRYRRLFVSED